MADKNIGSLVFVFDPTDADGYHIPNGKQTLTRSHIFYTPCSGIWQTVWLESVPDNYITSMDISAGADGNGEFVDPKSTHSLQSIKLTVPVTATIYASGNGPNPVEVSVLDNDGRTIASQKNVVADRTFTFNVPSKQLQLWTPDTPRLYNLTVKMGADIVSSYTGFRTISSGIVKGVRRPLLNGKFVFHFGTLDQGFWPDGIQVPPTLEAMEWDLLLLKRLGMNIVRKHVGSVQSPCFPCRVLTWHQIKIEPDLFYYACDRLGLLVYQDMPSMKATVNVRDDIPTAEDQAEFERQLELMISEHKSHPSIVAWVLYNEGWGQIKLAYQPEIELVDRVRKLDPTRLIDATSGWYDHGAGDFSVCLASAHDAQALIAVRTTTTTRNRNAARPSTQTHLPRTTQTGSASRASSAESAMFRPTRGLQSSRDMLQIPANLPTHTACGPFQGQRTASTKPTSSVPTLPRTTTGHACCSVFCGIRWPSTRAAAPSGRKPPTSRAR